MALSFFSQNMTSIKIIPDSFMLELKPKILPDEHSLCETLNLDLVMVGDHELYHQERHSGNSTTASVHIHFSQSGHNSANECNHHKTIIATPQQDTQLHSSNRSSTDGSYSSESINGSHTSESEISVGVNESSENNEELQARSTSSCSATSTEPQRLSSEAQVAAESVSTLTTEASQFQEDISKLPSTAVDQPQEATVHVTANEPPLMKGGYCKAEVSTEFNLDQHSERILDEDSDSYELFLADAPLSELSSESLHSTTGAEISAPNPPNDVDFSHFTPLSATASLDGNDSYISSSQPNAWTSELKTSTSVALDARASNRQYVPSSDDHDYIMHLQEPLSKPATLGICN